jgi:hypothetical protein
METHNRDKNRQEKLNIFFLFLFGFILSVHDSLLKSTGAEQYALSYKTIELITAIAVLSTNVITMCMRQFTYIENQKLNKTNRAKKKLSKLVLS